MLDFSIWHVLWEKVQVTPHSNLAILCPAIPAEWDWLASGYIRNSCCSFFRCLEANMAKNDSFVE
jgi:hypothetical protein